MKRKATIADDLAGALRVMLADETAIAKNSYTNYGGGRPEWNDRVWRAADLDGFLRVLRARRALKRYDAQRTP